MSARYVMGDFGGISYRQGDFFTVGQSGMGLTPLPFGVSNIQSLGIKIKPASPSLPPVQAQPSQPLTNSSSDNFLKNYFSSIFASSENNKPSSGPLKTHAITPEQYAFYENLQKNGISKFTPKSEKEYVTGQISSKTELKDMVVEEGKKQSMVYQGAQTSGAQSESNAAPENKGSGKLLALGGAALAAFYIFGE